MLPSATMNWRAAGLSLLIAILTAWVTPAYSQVTTPETTCGGCHEIESSSVSWSRSGHRDFHCKECHGAALTNGLHSLKEKAMMVIRHFAGPSADHIRLTEKQVVEISNNCKRCHGTEYSQWISGGHSTTYASIFLNSSHNSTEQLNADCLRCHGMFYGGTIEELVTPLRLVGPWKLKNPEQGPWPAIPCLACHKLHREGLPAIRADYAEPKNIFYARDSTVTPAAWYDRYEKTHVDAADLPALRLFDGDRAVRVADDPRQRICVQCHAPNAFHQAGSGDDRTPRGVHEGLSCLACHEGHSNDSRRSCRNCHPAISNCQLDVTKMNTTFADRRSPHNIHFVGCTDCHVKGIPPKRRAPEPTRAKRDNQVTLGR